MDASGVYTHSVFDLISKLAVLLLQEEHTQKDETYAYAFVPTPAAVSKKRTEIYESLLRIPGYLCCPRLDRLPKCKKLLEEQRVYFDSLLIDDITYCLLKVSKKQDIPKDLLSYLQSHKAGYGDRCRLLVPKPMRLEEAPYKRVQHDDIFGQPKFFKSIEDSIYESQPVEFSRKTNLLSNIYEINKPAKSCEKKYIFSSAWKKSMDRMNEFKADAEPMKTNFPEPPMPKEVPQKTETRNEEEFKKYPDKHFFSDRCLTNEGKWHQDPTIRLSFIELPDFIDHLKKASAGLQSESFLWNPDDFFEMRANSTIRTVLPEVLADFSQPFLDSGCAYRRLMTRSRWNYSNKCTERPMNRTMRQAITDFLANSRLYLISLPAKNLSQLLRCAGPTMQLLLQLDQMFQTDYRLNIAQGTNGACLLSVIWSAIDVCVNVQYLQLLMYLLRSLCKTYCGQLQRWLYHGLLDDSFNEIFVGTQRCFDEKSKEFFDRAHFVREHMVPGFLAGCEPAIIQCGKYSRLLKQYNPQHMLFTSKHPDLVVCLSQDQLTEMQNKLTLHYKQLLEHIHPFRMESVVEERRASKWRFGNRMWSCTQERIADWKESQRELLIKANEGKRLRYEEINNELKEQEQIRLEHRRMEIASELAFQQKCNQQDEENLRRDKLIMEERIAAYEKAIKPMEITVVDISPGNTTDSSRSFVSCCGELDSEEASMEAQNTEKTLTGESEFTPNLGQTNQHKLTDMSEPSQALEQTDHDKLSKDKKHSDLQNSNDIELQPESITDEKQSDQQNSNGIDTEMERNRNRNMCSEQFQECQTEVELKQTTTTTHALTDLECNRLRVLGCTDMQTQLPPDVNMNLEDLSDMQRNRNRMQNHQLIGSFSKTNLHTKTEKELDKNVGLSVALHLPLESNKLFVEPALDTATPMSTTSDVEIETCIPNESVDAANNNINGYAICDDDDNEDVVSIKIPKTLPKSPALKLRQPELKPKMFQLKRNELPATCHRQQLSDHNSFLIKRYVQQSIMVPLKTHLSLLRNEVLRIFDDLNVYEYFCQLRNYFFLLDGEFGTMLIGGILERMESGMDPRGLCQKGALDAILNNALGHRTTDGSGPAALFAESLILNCEDIPESFDLMNINALSIFTLKCKVDWPLNLVISVETMAKYTQIFSHLLKLRHVNFMLERAYQHLQELGKLHGKALHVAPQYRHLQMIRHKLSHFVITLQNHLDTNALQGTWETFNDKLRSVDSVEGLYMRHVEYLKHIAFISLLNRRSVKFLETIDNILVIVLRFCKILHSKSFDLDQNQVFTHPRYKRLVFEESEFEKFLHYVIYLGNKVDASGYQEKIVELIRIINFNNYYNVTNSRTQAK